MKVVQVVPALGPGGAEAFAVDLAIALQERGWSSGIHVICDVRGERGALLAAQAQEAGVVLDVGGLATPRSIWALVQVTRALKRLRADVLLAHLPSSEMLVALAVVALKSRNAILLRTIHNTRQPGGIASVLEPILARRFARTIACSKEVLDSIGGEDRHRVFVDNGISLRRLGPELPTRLRGLGVQSVVPRFAMIGSTRYGLVGGQKGVDIAIEAIARVPDAIGVELHLLGCTESDRTVIEQYAYRLGVGNRVVIHGAFASIRAELVKISPIACLLPSRHEGLPLSLLEYSCLGVPVIASDIAQVMRLNSPAMLWTIVARGSSDELALAIARWAQVRNVPGSQSMSYAAAARNKFGFGACLDGYCKILESCRRY